MLTKGSLRFRALLVIAIVILLNVLLSRFFLRLDFTGDQRYTLSNATKNILKNLGEPVTVTAYFSENLPPHIQKTKKDFQDLLIEYSNHSGGELVYEFVNPNESEELEQKALQDGVRTVAISVRERDQVKQQRGYLGAKLQYGEKTEVIPFIEPGAAMEYALSSSIKKISATDKAKIGWVTGQGEASTKSIQQAMQELGVLYDVKEVALTDSALISDYKTLAIVAPTDSFDQAALDNLDKFLATGKSVLVAANRMDANLQAASAEAITTGLETWLEGKGITLNENLVSDKNCGAITVQEQQSFFVFNRQIPFPFLPIIQKFADHTITKGLEQVIFPFVSSLTYTEKEGQDATFTPLAQTSGRSGLAAPPITFDVKKEWGDSDFPTSNVVVAGILEGKLSGDAPSKLVIFGDGDFAVNGEGQQAQQLGGDNVNLLINAIDYLSDDSGLNELRTKGVSSRPIQKDLSDSTKQMVKVGNFLLPILLIILFGVIRSQIRKAKKMKWASERW